MRESNEVERPVQAMTLSRRGLLSAGGALLAAFVLPLPRAQAVVKGGHTFEPNAFIRLEGSGRVTLIMPQVEMGQGVYTAIAMILAEEMGARWDSIVLEAAPPNDALYGNPIFQVQVTGNSNSIRAFWLPLRKAGAGARERLREAAARRWGVPVDRCVVSEGEVLESPGSRRLSFGQLADAAGAVTPAAAPVLKPVDQFHLIGRPTRRLDTPAKADGTAKFGIDALPPGTLFATLMACPVVGGTVAQVDESAARAVPGVRQIVVLDDLVAVVGTNTWAARQGLDALKVTWSEGDNAAVDSQEMWRRLREASGRPGAVARAAGPDAGGWLTDPTLENVYELPLLAHAAMEPMNCTVHVRPDSCEIWVGTQVITRAQGVAARITGLPVDKVTVHNHLLGGGFGRRLEVDGVEKAVRIAQRVSAPVKVTWTREEDIRQDIYRPLYSNRIAARISDGAISAWSQRITGSSVMARWAPPLFQKGIDIDAVDAAVDMPYDIPSVRVEYTREEPPGVRTGFWRGVGPNDNVFAIESFMDDVARGLGRDPVEFRLSMLSRNPRLAAALRTVAQRSGWGTPLPTRVGRGVAAQGAFGSFIATVAEVSVDETGAVHVRRIVTAVDTGIVVNPDTVIAQLQGGLIFGLTAALYGEITVHRGRIDQSNFHDYRMLRIHETPAIDVHLMASPEAPGGIGETGTAAALPALRNAILAATGVALKRMPIDPAVLRIQGA